LHHPVQTAEWRLLLDASSWRWRTGGTAAVAVTGIRQVKIVTKVRDLFTHVALVLFIADVISDNECRKERETVF
jgi:hypothetical protein